MNWTASANHSSSGSVIEKVVLCDEEISSEVRLQSIAVSYTIQLLSICLRAGPCCSHVDGEIASHEAHHHAVMLRRAFPATSFSLRSYPAPMALAR